MVVGVLAGKVIASFYAVKLPERLRQLLILGVGYGLFVGSKTLSHLPIFGVELHFEALLICMVAGFAVSNLSRFRHEFEHSIEVMAPVVFLVFFTVTGLGMNVGIVAENWQVVAVLAGVRLVAMYGGTLLGGTLAGMPAKDNRILGLTFITQAGISLGLTSEAAKILPGIGSNFASVFAGVIIVNTCIGPGLMKWILGRSGETNHGLRTVSEFPERRGAHGDHGVESQTQMKDEPLAVNQH